MTNSTTIQRKYKERKQFTREMKSTFLTAKLFTTRKKKKKKKQMSVSLEIKIWCVYILLLYGDKNLQGAN